MNWSLALDVLGAVFLVLGAFMTIAAAIGLVRFPDLLSRLHATAKPQSLGIALLMTGLALSLRTPVITWAAILIVLFQLVTAPIAAHLAGRAGYRTGQVESGSLVIDEYRRALATAVRGERRRKAERERQRKRDREDPPGK